LTGASGFHEFLDQRIRQIVADVRDAEPLYREILQLARVVSGSQRQCLVLLRAEQGRELVWSTVEPGISLEISDTVIEHVLREGVEFSCDDVVNDWLLRDSTSVRRLSLAAIFCLPLRRPEGGAPFGALYLDDQHDSRRFTPAVKARLISLAGKLAEFLPDAPGQPLPAAPGEDLAPGVPQLLCSRGSPLEQVRQRIAAIAAYPHPVPVLITGESGTGKEVVARHLYYQRFGHGPEEGRPPFVAMNCGLLQPALMASELFGHVRGGYTGADTAREGLFRTAGNGVLFLDEIATVPRDVQAALLRVLEQRMARPVGADKEYKAECWVIAATNDDLAQRVASGAFRADLFYRLNRAVIKLPPLRERQDDILLLANHFIRQELRGTDLMVPVIDAASKALLLRHHWPGNVRELQNAVQQALIFRRDHRLQFDSLDGLNKPMGDAIASDGDDVPPDLKKAVLNFCRGKTLDGALDIVRCLLLEASLMEHNGRVTDAAAAMGKSQAQFSRLIQRCRLDPRHYRRKGE